MAENGPAWEPISFDPTHRIVPARAEVHGGRGIGQVFPLSCSLHDALFLSAVASWTISSPQRPFRHTTAMHPWHSSADKPVDVARKPESLIRIQKPWQPHLGADAADQVGRLDDGQGHGHDEAVRRAE